MLKKQDSSLDTILIFSNIYSQAQLRNEKTVRSRQKKKRKERLYIILITETDQTTKTKLDSKIEPLPKSVQFLPLDYSSQEPKLNDHACLSSTILKSHR